MSNCNYCLLKRFKIEMDNKLGVCNECNFSGLCSCEIKKFYQDKISELDKLENEYTLKLYEYGKKEIYYGNMKENIKREIRSIINKRKLYKELYDKEISLGDIDENE